MPGMPRTIAIGSDHAGYMLKERIKRLLHRYPVQILDVGTDSEDPVDYPDLAEKVALLVLRGTAERGILVCGTGIGVAITANKFPGVRAAVCLTPHMVEMARRHNDANIMTLGGRLLHDLEDGTLEEMVRLWLEVAFEGGRHARRVAKIAAIEQRLLVQSHPQESKR